MNNQQCNVDDKQEARWKNIKNTIDPAAKDLRTRNLLRAISKLNVARIKMLQNTTSENTEEYKSRKEIAYKYLEGKKY